MSLFDLKCYGAALLVVAALWLLYLASPEGYVPRHVNFADPEQAAEFQRNFLHLPQSRKAYWLRGDWFNSYSTFAKTRMSKAELDSLKLGGRPQKFFLKRTPPWWELPRSGRKEPLYLYRVGNGDLSLYYEYDPQDGWLYELSAP